MSKKRRSLIEQINGQQGVNAQQTSAANNAAQKSKRVIAQKNIKEQGAAAPSMRERVIASQPISAPSVDERNYLQAAQRFFSAFGPQGAARQAADYAAQNSFTQYTPMRNGDPTSKAMDAYYATRPATEDTIAAASMAGWQLTPQQWDDILSGRAYIPDVTGWEYFTNDREARAAVERSVAEGAAFLDMGQDAGVFDTEGFLTPSNLNLASSEYISSMAGEYENMLANRDAAWNYPANLQWAAAVGNKGANWTIDMATEAMRVYNDDREFYEQYGPEGYYVALRDYADTMNVSQEGWDNIIGGVLVDMLKLNHVANGYDLATFDEAAALDELENLPEEEFYAFFNTWLPAFSGDQLGYETINWAQPGGLSSMFYAQGRRLPYMYTELQNREEYDQVVADIQAQIVSEGYSLTPDMFTQVEAEINEAYGGRIGDNTSYGYLMTPEEKTIYAYLRDMDPTGQEAKDYMELLMQTELYTRRSLANRAETTLYATDKAFAVPTFLNTGAALVGDVLSIPEKMYHAVTGTDNANAPWHDTTHYRSDVRGVQGAAIEEAGGDFWGPILRGGYDTAAGALDFGVSLALGKALGAIGGATGIGNAAQIAQSATGTIMGLSAGSANLTETAGTEMPATWRVISAATAYTVEGFTERYSIEALFDDPTDFITYWRNTFISGGTEEMASDILNAGFQFVTANITGIMPDLVEQYNELAANGQADAFTQVLTDAMTQLFYTGVIGGLSEGVIATPAAAASAYTNYTTGRAINTAGGQNRLIELGMAMREGSDAHALATALGRRAETTGRNGQPLRIPTSRLGQLYRTMLSETAEQYHDDVHQLGVESVTEAIAQRYSDLGLENEMETRYTAEELAEAIVKTAETGTEPGGAIGRYIREHRVTAEIMREFREGGSPWAETMRTRQAAAGLQAQMRAAQIKATKIKAEGGTETETDTDADADAEVTHEGIMTDEGIEAETTEEVRRLTRRMSTSELLSRSIVLGLEGGAEEQTELVRVERTGDGLSLVVNRGGEEVNVGLDDVAQVSGAGVARVLAYAQERKEVTAQEINDMIGLLETSGEGFKSSRLISLYESALNAGFFGEARDTLNYLLEGAGEATDAMRAVLEVGYRQGQMQQSQAEENRLRRRADKETTGKSKLVSFMGDVGADFNGIDTGVRRSVHELMGTMDEAQEAAVDVIEQVAKAVGVQVVLYRTMAENGQKVDAPNGFYDAASNAIFVDINSGITQGGQELVNYTVMHTFAHELTHYIEHNAADGYKTLRSMVQTVMAAKGGETNYAGLVMDKLRMSANLTTRAAAEAEVIADACELMLRNTTAIKTLAEQDVTLAAKVRNFVANFAAKIRRAFAGLVLNTKESALLTEMREGVITYVDGLQAAWDNALIEAANRNRVRSELTGQNQTDGTQQGKMSESEGINAESEAPMKMEAPSKDWHPELDEGWDRSKMPRLVTRGGEVQENAVDMAAEQGSTETEEINAESEAPRLPVVPRGDGVLERIAWIDSSKAPRLVTRGGEVQQATVDAETENAAGLAEAYDSQITRAAAGEGMSRTFEGWATETGQGAMPFDRDTTVSMAEEIARAATEALNTLQSPDQLGDDANADAMTQAEETARQSALNAAREMVNSVYEGNDAAIREKLTALAGNVAEEAVNAWMVIRARVAARAAAREKSGELDGGVNVDAGTGTASISYSQRTWWDSDYVRKRDETVRKLMKQLKVTKSEAESWIDNVTGIANYIATNKDRLDYVSSIFGSPFKSNPEYGGTIDMSTLCPKRHLATGTLDAIQTLLGDVELDRNDFLRIREKMKAKGYEVACGLCFVESSRANMSKYVADFVKSYNKKNNAQIAIPMLNTVDGIERTRTEMPEVYEAFEEYMNRLAQRKPKLFEKRTEYRDEILRAFAKDENVESKNRMGGLRIQSFSDFEIVHLIDMMQVIMDMAAVGLAGQAYTKQPDFAWALGRTGLKINLSLIAKGVDENGNLIFDPVEGMDPVVARKLRDTYSENVGTIVVVFTDAELKAAMKNEMVDFIIPFHRSQWKKSDYKKLGLDAKTRDYTLHQNERHTWKDDKGKWHTTKVEENYYPMNYWDFGLSGKENAQAYLDMCYRDGRIPKFPFLLDKGADGRYKLKEDGSTDGYWKLLIDFKMYNNDGVGAKQMPVRPEFNMEEANRMLKSYEGGHENFPVAQDVVDEFVQEYNNRKGVKVEAGKRVRLAEGNVQYSERLHPDLTVRDAMMAITDTTGMTEAERSLLNRYQWNVTKLDEVVEAIAEQTAIKNNADAPETERTKAKQELWRLWRQRKAIEKELIEAENDGGYAKLMTTAGEMLRLLTVKDTMPEVTEELNRRIREVAAQLEEVQGTLGEQAEADMWNTLQSLFDKKKLRSAARRLKELYGARISEDKLMHRIVLIQSTLMRGGENASRDYLQMVEELTRELRSKGKQDNSEMLEILREHVGTIALTDVQRQEINSKIGMKEFLRVVKPVVRIVPKGQNGVTLDMRLVDAGGREGDYNPLLPYFQGHENEGDSIMQLYDLISGAKKADPYAGQYGREMLQEEMVEVMSIANSAALLDAGIETVQSVMDALTQNANASDELTGKVYKLKEEMIRTGRAASEAAYNAEARHRDLDSVIDYLTRLETQDMLLKQQDADRLVEKQVKDKSNKRIQAIIDERDQRERNRVIRERIKRTVGWMEKRIRKETDRKNVPEELKPYIEEAIRIFVEHNDVLKVFKKAEINDIRRVFDALKDYDKPNDSPMNDIIRGDIEDAFKALKINLQEYGAASKLKDTKKKTMYRHKALENIDEIVERLWGQIRKYNEIFMDGKAVQLSSVAEQTAEAMKTRDDYSVADKAGAKLWESIVKSARNKNLTPVYFFRLLKGNNVMQTLQEDVIRAQSEYGKLYRKAKKRIEEIQAKHHYWEWKNADALEFTTTQGKLTKDGKHDVVLTVDEAMSIWATWKREEVTTPLFESTHLSNGGFKLASGKRKVNGRIIEDNTPHKLTKADIDIIDAYLTEEQKAYATEMVEYMSRDMAEIGNRASMQMYGIRKFKESFYFPMSVHRDQLAQSSNKGAKNPDANRIAGMASAHRRVEKAWKALSIGSFSEVAANHINDMLLYGTFAVPIENFNSVLNYNYVGNPLDTDTEGASSMTVRALFRQKYGTDLTQYMEQYLADLNGGTGVKESSKLASLHRRSAVMASMSVMLQQPLSIIRAWAVQNPKYYMQAIRGKAPEHGEWEQLLKYSGVAVIKDINGFDMSSGRTMASGLLGNPEDAYNLAQKAAALVGVNVKGERLAGAKRQWEDLLGLGAQKADQLAWVYMWRAAKAETAEKHKGMNTNSEEFLNLAARRFEEVVNLTQVYNSTLVRSQNMRSKSQFAQMVTAFMAEPTLTWNMLMDGVQESLDSKSAKPIAKAAGIFLISQIATAVVKSLWTAGRDDDEEKPWLEKYLAAVGGELGGIGSSLNIFNLLPYARDVMSLLEGYDVERADMSLIADLATEVNKINSGKYDDAPMVGVKNLVFALANLLGIPAKNLWRDVNTGITTVKGIVQPGRAVNVTSLANDAAENYLGWLPWVDTSNAAYYERIYRAMERGDAEEVTALTEYMGIQGKDAKAVRNGVKGVVKERLLAGKITAEEAKAFLLANGIVDDEKAAFEAVDSWTEGSENYSAYNSVRNAIAQGDLAGADAAADELIDNGWSAESVLTQVRSQADASYMAGTLTQEEVKRLHERTDWDENRWYWHFRELDYGIANGGSTKGWTKFMDYLEAVRTAKNLRNVTMDYLDHGVEKGTLKKQLRGEFREEYRTLYRTNKTKFANLRANLVNALVVMGETRDNAMKYLDGWLED